MRKSRKTTVLINTLIFLLLGSTLSSCKKDNTPEYKGENKVVLHFKDKLPTEAEEIQAGSGKVVKVYTTFTHKMDEEATIAIILDGACASYVEATPREQKIKRGERQASFDIKLKDNTVTDKCEVQIRLIVTPNDKRYKNDHSLKLILLPKKEIAKLTDEQKNILNYYKEEYALNIYALLGDWRCQGSYEEPGDGYFEPFIEHRTVSYENEITYIELSPRATKEEPILRMTSNALGLKSYFQTHFEGLTIKNKDYWNNEFMPNAQTIMKRILWTPESKETYDVALDISINPRTKELLVIKPLNQHLETLSEANRNLYYGWQEEDKVIVPFIFLFSPWQRVIEVEDKGTDSDWRETIQSGSVHPYQILFSSSIAKDEWKDELDEIIVPYVAPAFSLDWEKLELTYQFSHNDSSEQSGYTAIKGVCTKE